MTVIALPLYRAIPIPNGRARLERTPALDLNAVSAWLQGNVQGGGEAEIVRSEKVVRFRFQDDADAALFQMRWG